MTATSPTKHHGAGQPQGNTIAVVAVGRLQAAVYTITKLNHASSYDIKLYLHSLGGECSQSTDSNSSRGNCEQVISTLQGKRHPTWVGPGNRGRGQAGEHHPT